MFGENQEFVPDDALVYILADPAADGSEWIHVHVAPSMSWWPNDYFSWLPKLMDGQPTIRLLDVATCPDGEIAIADIVALSPPDRLRCFANRELTFAGLATSRVGVSGYRVVPDWFGDARDEERTIAVGIDRRHENSIDVQLPPGVDPPPTHFKIQVRGSFDHPDAGQCTRSKDRPEGLNAPVWAGLPVEPQQLSILWCRERFVASELEVIEGPEGRPPVVGDVQLHRFPAINTACAGVGLPMLRIRIDPSQLDAVWIESVNGSRHIAYWGPDFSFESEPGPLIRDGGGNVVAVDGEPLDPDRPLHGHAVCPSGEIIYIGP